MEEAKKNLLTYADLEKLEYCTIWKVVKRKRVAAASKRFIWYFS